MGELERIAKEAEAKKQELERIAKKAKAKDNWGKARTAAFKRIAKEKAKAKDKAEAEKKNEQLLARLAALEEAEAERKKQNTYDVVFNSQKRLGLTVWHDQQDNNAIVLRQ